MGEENDYPTLETEPETVDSENMELAAINLPLEIKQAFELGKEVKLEGAFDRILVCGMGGSGIPGNILRCYLKDSKIPIEIYKEYSLPHYLDKKTLVFCVSDSGNTEETLSMFKDAARKHCRIVCIAEGGRLEKLAEVHRVPFIKIPAGLEPRAALAYLFFPIIRILQENKLIPHKEKEVRNVIESLQKHDVQGIAEKLSSKLVDKIPLIYSSEMFYPVAYRWKTQFNENSKILAFSNKFSELNHNEIEGYTQVKGDFHVIILTIDEDLRRIQKRIRITKELIQKQGVPITEINIKGNYFLTKIFSAIQIGDLTSEHLALRYKIDPGPVKIIEEFKDKLGPFI